MYLQNTSTAHGILQKSGQKSCDEPDDQRVCCDIVCHSNIRSFTYEHSKVRLYKNEMIRDDSNECVKLEKKVQ